MLFYCQENVENPQKKRTVRYFAYYGAQKNPYWTMDENYWKKTLNCVPS